MLNIYSELTQHFQTQISHLRYKITLLLSFLRNRPCLSNTRLHTTANTHIHKYIRIAVVPAPPLRSARYAFKNSVFLALLLSLVWINSAHSASKSILVVGDSLSAEYGIARGSGWVTLLQQRLQANKLDYQVINASISGDTSSGGKARLPLLLQQHHPAIVIIELGANDALRGLSLEATTRNLRDMISIAQQDKAKVLLIGMHIPPNYGRAYTEKFFSLYAELAAQTQALRVPFLLEGVADQPELMQADRLHPTAAAHPIILNNVWPRLKPLLQ